MFEDKTYETIMEEMLDGIDPAIDTRQGSVIYDAISPVAMELAQMYADMGLVEDECFADSASYYYLIKRAAERGIFVREGTPSVLKIHVVPENVDIPLGTECNAGELNYVVTEKLPEEGYYSITCTETGKAGNLVNDDIIPMENVDGLEAIEFVSILASGTDDEDEEALRERYFESFSEVTFGGNKKEYKEKAKEFPFVGACRPIPVWNGGGTVKLIVLNSEFDVADAGEIQQLQDAFDPEQNGMGDGIAPIGHVVTVVSAEAEEVNVLCGVTLADGYCWEDVAESARLEVEKYFYELRKTWEDIGENETLVIRSGQIEDILIHIPGIRDAKNVLLNGKAGNLYIDGSKIPKAGEVVGQTVD